MKTIQDLNISKKRVLVRFDLNVPLNEMGEITNDKRINAALPTILSIIENNGRLVILSHLGRPLGQVTKGLSLRPVAKRLSAMLSRPVSFSENIIGPEAVGATKNLNDGEIIIMENVRFDKREEEGDEIFTQELAKLGDVYINDAFGTAHRAHASTTLLASHFKGRCAFGQVMFREISNVNRVLVSKESPVVAIVGGSKVSSKIDVLERLLDRSDHIIIGGGMAFTFVKALGGQIGDSICESERTQIALKILDKAKAKEVKIHLPIDTVAADAFSIDAKTQVCSIFEIPAGWQGLDAGPKTIMAFSKIVSQAKTLLWNGPLGVFEMEPFSKGTRAIGESIAKATSKGLYSLVGGGDSVAAVEQFGLSDRVSYVSTGGGAMLEYLEGKTLPGIQAIIDNSQTL
jgi:phosphoglycerate kinase|tara:strand:- start:23375 stop:24580 length:1206 start_codon:yes stop_codon:yes gene_type:complete